MFLGLVLIAGACTSDSSEGSETTTSTTLIEAGGRTAVDGLVSLCRSMIEAEPPDITSLAIDPSVTGQVLSIPDDLVDDASRELFECLGPELAAEYMATKIVVTGVLLPAETADCLPPWMPTAQPSSR